MIVLMRLILIMNLYIYTVVVVDRKIQKVQYISKCCFGFIRESVQKFLKLLKYITNADIAYIKTIPVQYQTKYLRLLCIPII